MSIEINRALFNRIAAGAVMSSAAILGAAAVDANPVGAAAASNIERCYSTPQPNQELAELPNPPEYPNQANYPTTSAWQAAVGQWQAANALWLQQEQQYNQMINPPELSEPVVDGLVEGDPVAPPTKTTKKVQSSLVEVSAGEWEGTGFLTRDKKGQEVVVTAAHVIGKASFRGIQITSDSGKTTTATGGCYIYENDGQFQDLSAGEGSPVDQDVAVLKLKNKLGKHTLSLASQEPSRGSWSFFMNYQNNNEPGYPASYSGLVVSVSPPPMGFDVITGIEYNPLPPKKRLLMDSDQLGPGASGGPVFDSDGEIIGMSVAGTTSGQYEDADELQSGYNVTFPGAIYGNTTGFEPDIATLMPNSTIQAALDSPSA